jgi:hypothetical protein
LGPESTLDREVEIEKLLQIAALVLSVVNGLILVRVHLRDRAKLSIAPVHPDVYQWWFRLPDSTFEGRTTRVFGFLAYVGISNRGFRPVSLERWRLRVRSRGWRRVDLRAINIPEPMLKMGTHGKVFAVLGQKGVVHEGRTRIDPGDSTSGMVFYVYEWWGHESWEPRVRKGRVRGSFKIRDVYGGTARCCISFAEKELDFIKQLIPDIESIPYAAEHKPGEGSQAAQQGAAD